VSSDDDADCVEHVWQLQGVVLGGGVHTDYVCVRCGALLVRAPGEPFPDTV
jgi:hypothetical protein